MVIFPFLRSWLFWLPLVFVALLELSFRWGWWESWMIWSSHAGRTIVTKRAVESIDRTTVNIVMLGDSRAHQGFDHKALAQQASAHQRGYIDLALPGVHFLSLKVFARYAREQLAQLQGVIVVLPPAFLQSIGNGEYELGIVHPLRRYTSTQEMQHHVPLRQDDLNTWASVSELVAYRDNVQQLLRNGFADQRVGQVNAASWWLHWRAEYSEDLCALDLAQAELCSTILQQPPQNQAERSVHQFCSRPGLEGKTYPGADQVWLGQSAAMTAEWRAFLLELAQQQRVLVVTLPMLPLFQRYEVLPEAEQASRQLLQELSSAGTLEWLDLGAALDPAQAECGYYRDLWHLNQRGQAQMTTALSDYLDQHWYPASVAVH